MSESYLFPLLTPEECVSFFREISDAPISEEDFKKPDAKRWNVFYQKLFEEMTGRPADLIYQSLFQHGLGAVSDLENPELHEESLSLMTFAMAMKRVMNVAKVANFSVEDILEPNPKRLVRIVSAAVNFIRFQHFRKDVFQKKKEEVERKRESFKYTLKENADLKKVLQAKKEAHAARIQKMEQLVQENEMISQRLQEQHKQRELLQRNLSEVKSELSHRNAAIDQLKVNILTAQAEGEKLSQRIVQSPERMKAEQERAKNRIMALKSTQEEKQKRLMELQRQTEQLGSQGENILKGVRLLRDISNESDKIQELERKLSRQQECQQEARSALQSAAAKVDNLRQVHVSRRDRLSKLELQYNAKRAAMQQQMQQLEQLNESIQDPKEKSELLAATEGLKAEIAHQEKELGERLEKANSNYFQILQQVDKKNMVVASGFEKLVSILRPK